MDKHCTHVHGNPAGGIYCVDISQGGDKLVSGSYDGKLMVWGAPITLPVALSGFDIE